MQWHAWARLQRLPVTGYHWPVPTSHKFERSPWRMLLRDSRVLDTCSWTGLKLESLKDRATCSGGLPLIPVYPLVSSRGPNWKRWCIDAPHHKDAYSGKVFVPSLRKRHTWPDPEAPLSLFYKTTAAMKDKSASPTSSVLQFQQNNHSQETQRWNFNFTRHFCWFAAVRFSQVFHSVFCVANSFPYSDCVSRSSTFREFWTSGKPLYEPYWTNALFCGRCAIRSSLQSLATRPVTVTKAIVTDSSVAPMAPLSLSPHSIKPLPPILPFSHTSFCIRLRLPTLLQL